MTERVGVDVLGATGLVGQNFLARLERHPWFEVRTLRASDRSVGKRYAEAVRWTLPTEMPSVYRDLVVAPCEPDTPGTLALSAVEGDVARSIEAQFRGAGSLVISSTRAHRLDDDVPLIVPEVNADHLALARTNAAGGVLLAHPNCTTVGLTLTLAPLRAFGLRRIHVVSMQALSGAGLAGLADETLQGDVVSHIPGEEEKVRAETGRILGTLREGAVQTLSAGVSAQCNRVPVADGHTLSVLVEFETDVDADALRQAWNAFPSEEAALTLPSAPARPVRVLEPGEAPRPALHAETGGGMSAVVGRIQQVDARTVSYVTVSHNAVRGAAGGTLLLAELALSRGLGAG